MLILERKAGEQIKIGDGITVIVTAISGDRVKIGVDAPLYVAVHRKEVYEVLQRRSVTDDSKSEAS